MAQAPGKFILGGEHSIVYQGRALAFPLPKVALQYLESSQGESGFFLNSEKCSDSHTQNIYKLREALKIRANFHRIEVQTQIPFGAGLGSSAALCTAMLRFHFKDLAAKELALQALEGEKLFHEKPSGVDPFVVAIEKPIAFHSQSLEWKEIELENFYRQDLCFVLVDSGERHRTLEVIEIVSKLRKECPLIFSDLIDALASNAESMLKALAHDPKKDLGRLMNDTHFRLLQLGVSTEALDDLQAKMLQLGARGAKLTGAGKGGFMLCLFEREAFESIKGQIPQPYFEG